MKQFQAFIIKEFRHILRDRRTMLILLGIPVVQIVLFGFAITTEVNHVRMAVLDPSNDVESRRIIDRFQATNTFDVVRSIRHPEEMEALLRRGDVSLVLVFPHHFARNITKEGTSRVQLIVDGSDPNTGRTIEQYARSVVAGTAPSALSVKTSLLYNPQMKSSYQFVPGLMGLILMLICAMMTSISIVREKETGTMEVLLASPVRPLYIVLAKMIPYLVLSLVILGLILLLSVTLLGVPIRGSILLLSLLSFIYILVALSLGLFISSVVDTQVKALLVSGMMLMLPIMILSGMIYPIESMPAALQAVTCIVPARWFITAVRKVMIQGTGVSEIAQELSILAGMAVLLLAVSIKKFNPRLSD